MKVAIYYDQDGDEVERWTDEKMYIIKRELRRYGTLAHTDLITMDGKEWSATVWTDDDPHWDSPRGWVEFNYDPRCEMSEVWTEYICPLES